MAWSRIQRKKEGNKNRGGGGGGRRGGGGGGGSGGGSSLDRGVRNHLPTMIVIKIALIVAQITAFRRLQILSDLIS